MDVKERELREHLLKQLARLEKNDMTKQYNVINMCVYEMVRKNEFLTIDTLVDECNLHYIVQDRARYGKIVPQRVQRAIGGSSRTAHHDEINCKLSSSGWRLKLGKSTCKAFFADKNAQHELDLNAGLINNSANLNKVNASRNGEIPTREEIELAESQVRNNSNDEVINEEAVLDQVEKNLYLEGISLKENWRETAKQNIRIWFSKG